MTLSDQPTYSSTRNYVLKLRREGQIAGRLENMSTGCQFDFCSAEELLACLTADVTSTALRTSAQEPNRNAALDPYQ